MMKFLKYIIFGIVLLFLLHFETFNIGIIKFSHLWKSILLLYLIIKLIKQKEKVNFFIYKPLIILSFLQLINLDLLADPVYAFKNFLTMLLIPVIGLYILIIPPKTIKNGLIFFCSFFILSFLPYYFNVLKSYGEQYPLSRLGIFGYGLVGPFQNAHGASITLATSLIVILFFLLDGSYNKYYLLAIFTLGVLFIINVFVRTGIAMLLVGTITVLLFFLRFKKSKHVSNIIFIIVILFTVTDYFVLPNEAFINRISGKTQYYVESEPETIGSGRGLIYITSLMIYKNANAIEKIMGMGKQEQQRRIERLIGLKIGSHNAFLDVLLVNGALGLIVFLTYLINILRLLKISEKSNYWILSVALFWSIIIMSFVQGFDWLTANLLFMLSVSYYFKTKHL